MPRKLEQSRKLQKRAERLIPGGVNSPVRAFKAVGGDPPFLVRGSGSRVWDADGNEYIDYIGSWGPLILGHAAPKVVEAVTAAAKNGIASPFSRLEEIGGSGEVCDVQSDLLLRFQRVVGLSAESRSSLGLDACRLRKLPVGVFVSPQLGIRLCQ